MVNLKIIEIIDETHDVKTFRFSRPKDFSFIAGQFCMVSIDGIDKKIPLTFSSSPVCDQLDITVKEVGEFTLLMFKLKVGDSVLIDGPRGKIQNFDESIDKDIIFIAGGSGVTPYMSSIRYAIDKKMKNQIFLFFGNRSIKDIIYYQELKKIDNENSNIHVINVLSEEKWDGETGFITKDLIEKYVDVNNKLFYVCGPPVMNKVVKEMLLNELKIDEEKIIMDKWEIPGKDR